MLRFDSGWLFLIMLLIAVTGEAQPVPQDSAKLATFLENLGMDELAARQRLNQLELESDPVRRFELAMSVTRWLDAKLEQEPNSELPSRWIDRLQSSVEADLFRFVVSKRQLSKINTRVLATVFQADQQRDLVEELQAAAREFRNWEQSFQQWEANLRKTDGELAAAPLQDLIQLGRIEIAWCIYYQWLLQPRVLDQSELQDAGQTLMSLLGIGEPDLGGSQPFRWYEGSDPLERRALLGLTLILAAEGRVNESNTCLSTLQQKASVRQSAQFLYFQWLTLFRSRAFANASDLQRRTLERMAAQDRTEAARLAISQLEFLVPLLPNPPVASEDRSAARELAGDLLAQLVKLGRIEEAATWQKDWALLPEGSPERQVVTLHQTIQALGLIGQDQRQLRLLAERLETLSRGKNPGIRLWALSNLEKVYQTTGERQKELTVLKRRFELESEPQSQQELAWRIAQRLESEKQFDEADQWYNRVMEIQWRSSLVALAKLRSKLLRVPGDWRQRVAILQAAMREPEIEMAARDQLLAEWYGGWKQCQDPVEKETIADKMQVFLRQMLPSNQPLSRESDVSKAAIQIQLLEFQLASQEEGSVVAERTRLELIDRLEQIYEWALDENGMIAGRDAVPTRQLLLKGLPYWDQAEQNTRILNIRRAVDVERLTAGQGYLLLSYSVRAMLKDGVDATERQVLKTDARQLLEWVRAGQLPLSTDSVDAAELMYLRVLRETGATREAIDWLKETELGKSRPLKFRIEAGRVLAEGQQWKSAFEIWRPIGRETLAGTDLWFEAQYWILRSQQEWNPKQANVELNKLLQLYPETTPDWQTRFQELSRELQADGP